MYSPVFALTGTGYAAGVLGPNSIGTKQLKQNSVISSKIKNRSLLAADFKAGQLPRGPKGDPGAPGAPGTPGAAGAPGQQGPAGPGAQWATVNSAGTIVRQSGGITAKRVQAGGYVVTFPEEVTGHLILVTPSLVSDLTTRGAAIAAPGVDFVASCGPANIARSVTVFTLSTTGSQLDHSFTVAQMGPNSTTATARFPGLERRRRKGSTLGK